MIKKIAIWAGVIFLLLIITNPTAAANLWQQAKGAVSHGLSSVSVFASSVGG